MRYDLVVSESININSSVEKVWSGLTNPEKIKEFLFGTNTLTDWKVGSEIIFQGEYQRQTYRDKGVILEFVENEKLSYSYWSGFSGLEDKPENYSTVTYLVEKLDDTSAKFTWIQKGFASEFNYEHSQNGMPALLAKIKEVLEK